VACQRTWKYLRPVHPITYTVTTTIPAPAVVVFEVLADPHRMAQWLPSARAVEAVSPLEKGSRIRVVYDTRETEIEVVDFNPPKVFGWAERVGRVNWKTFFRLEFAGGSTRLTVQQVWTPPSWIAWFRVRFRPNRNVPARLDTMVQNIRTVLAE
jgi:uncharacterized protein YndB with AHSA1/START domain